MTLAIITVGAALICLGLVGSNVMELSMRLMVAAERRVGRNSDRKIPRSKWKTPASMFLALFSPLLGLMWIFMSKWSRRDTIASIAWNAHKTVSSRLDQEPCPHVANFLSRWVGEDDR